MDEEKKKKKKKEEKGQKKKKKQEPHPPVACGLGRPEQTLAMQYFHSPQLAVPVSIHCGVTRPTTRKTRLTMLQTSPAKAGSGGRSASHETMLM